MLNQRTPSIETSGELPVENLHNEALAGFMQVHAELSKLPQDPKDPLRHSDALLREVGVDVDNDFSMFIMGAAGNMGIDAGLTALGLPAGGALSVGLDAATSLLMGMAEQSTTQSQSQSHTPLSRYSMPATQTRKGKKAGATSFFRAASYRKEPEAAPKKAPMANTSFLKKALARKKTDAVKKTAPKRNALKKQMLTHLETLKELQVFKSCGVRYAHRVTVKNDKTGTAESYLVAAKDKPHMALAANGKSYEKPIDVSMVPTPNTAPKYTFAA